MMETDPLICSLILLFMVAWGVTYLIECRVPHKVILAIEGLLCSATLAAVISLQALFIAMFCAELILFGYAVYLLNLRRIEAEISAPDIQKDVRAIP
jgi:hypothetical protein